MSKELKYEILKALSYPYKASELVKKYKKLGEYDYLLLFSTLLKLQDNGLVQAYEKWIWELTPKGRRALLYLHFLNYLSDKLRNMKLAIYKIRNILT